MNITLETMAKTFAEDMPSAAKLVYMAIVYHANVATGKAWPSRMLLAKETGLGVTTVSKAVAELCRRNFIIRRKSQSGNRYEIATDATRTYGSRHVNVPDTPDELLANGSCTSDERQMSTEPKKEHKQKLKNEHIYVGGEESFEKFWKEYPSNCPRKVDKSKCRAKYLKLWREAEDSAAFEAELIAALGRWKASEMWTKDGGNFIRAPLVWLSSRSWEDEPLTAKPDTAGAFKTEGYKLRFGTLEVA